MLYTVGIFGCTKIQDRLCSLASVHGVDAAYLDFVWEGVSEGLAQAPDSRLFFFMRPSSFTRVHRREIRGLGVLAPAPRCFFFFI